MISIPFCEYNKLFSPYVEDLLNITQNIIEDGSFIMGRDLQEFEKNFAKKIGARYAVGVGNATDGLEMLLAAHDMPEGAEVLVSSHTMTATASAVVSSGGQPIPVDIDELGMMDPSDLHKHLTPRTWAIMPTQLNGAICQISELKNFAEQHNLLVFEDSAQAFGASLNGKFAGNFGCGGVFSFYPAKILGCLGDGGMIVINDEEKFKKLRSMRDHGRTVTGDVSVDGRNSRLDNLQAAFLNYFLSNHFDNWIEHRKNLTVIYDTEFAKIEEVSVPKYNFREGHNSVFQNYEILVENRDELEAFLHTNGVSTLRQWSGKPIHQLEIFSSNTSLVKTEEYFKRYIMLPLNHAITKDQVTMISRLVCEFYAKD